MRDNVRYFVAKQNDVLAAYVKTLVDDGETFVCSTPGMQNICGAYCLPEYRGKGVYQNLLNYLIRTLNAEGFTRLGVDFESFNPTANAFWPKYFGEYTHSVVRRIDEHALLK
jgi:GNAT superfamily N-acetyltransferase